jgi:Skp family chaperone for outer membrane proteins
MKDWSDLEDKYQEMREKDSNGAEEFKKKMTERFQRTVQALEEESQAEKRQLQAMHQQRVISRINQVIHLGLVNLIRIKFVEIFAICLSYCKLI